MRSILLLFIACALLGACATEDLAVTGIPRARAIAIATVACKEYPSRYPVADRAKWIADGSYWVVDITDSYRERGRFFMIDRHGKIIGKGNIPAGVPESEVYRGRRADYGSPAYHDDEPHGYYDDRSYIRY